MRRKKCDDKRNGQGRQRLGKKFVIETLLERGWDMWLEPPDY